MTSHNLSKNWSIDSSYQHRKKNNYLPTTRNSYETDDLRTCSFNRCFFLSKSGRYLHNDQSNHSQNAHPIQLCIGIQTLLEEDADKWVISIKSKRNTVTTTSSTLPNTRPDKQDPTNHTMANHTNSLISAKFIEALFTRLLMIRDSNYGTYSSIVIITDGFFTQVGLKSFNFIQKSQDWIAIISDLEKKSDSIMWHPTDVGCFENLLFHFQKIYKSTSISKFINTSHNGNVSHMTNNYSYS
ncbi:hypothetical protein LIER_10662 [Lithospermum erythrorhizon]|uniref:Uncharacterized protein n=1 Tax=Lithospermum erythrorhizon TaxID=34254 RepID=A0AAV3PQ56_LITER